MTDKAKSPGFFRSLFKRNPRPVVEEKQPQPAIYIRNPIEKEYDNKVSDYTFDVYHGYKYTHLFKNAITLSEYGIEAGNEFFKAKNYIKAREFYTRAASDLNIADAECKTTDKQENIEEDEEQREEDEEQREEDQEQREEDEYYCNEVNMLLGEIYFRIGQTYAAENSYKDAVEQFKKASEYVDDENIKSNIEKYSSMVGGRRRRTVKKVKKTKKASKKNKTKHGKRRA